MAVLVSGSLGQWQSWSVAVLVTGSPGHWQSWSLAVLVNGSHGQWQSWLLAVTVSGKVNVAVLCTMSLALRWTDWSQNVRPVGS